MANLIVKSKVKEVVDGLNVAGEVPDALNKITAGLVEQAVKRAGANGRRTVQAKDIFVGRKASKTMIVIRSKVKEAVEEYNVAGDFAFALNEMIFWIIQQGCEKAKANGRRTLQARDL